MPQRLDLYLVSQGAAGSREKVKKLIETGNVTVNGKIVKKAGHAVCSDDIININKIEEKYVSRGGYKLERAINSFSLGLSSKICADIGASTGGFCDCMLQNGAEKIYAVDVGIGQLADKIKSDSRVINIEKCNFRYADENLFGEKAQFCSVDVSFISLRYILPALFSVMSDESEAICLIKPQFEAGKDNIGKNGIVKSKSVHNNVLNEIINTAEHVGFKIGGIDHSPITGGDGNIEYLIYIIKSKTYQSKPVDTVNTVETAFRELK
ncbi:MAG: TlyA family RNA methyltransferase [Clostridia bacterium]|nr:TlyA family RNA methyltransferase [Clostridia bacterium]